MVNHVCILIDGNRTYAIYKGKTSGKEIFNFAYLTGADHLLKIQKWSFLDFNIQTLSVALTTRANHFKRIDTMAVIIDSIPKMGEKWLEYYHDWRVRVKFIGDREVFINSAANPNEFKEAIEKIEGETEGYTDHQVFFMLAYDTRYEYQKLFMEAMDEGVYFHDTKKLIELYYGSDVPEVDFIIRPWRPRLSACIPILVGEYADIYFFHAPFQLLTKKHYKSVLEDYKNRLESKGSGFRYTNEEIDTIHDIIKCELDSITPLTLGTKIGDVWIPIKIENRKHRKTSKGKNKKR